MLKNIIFDLDDTLLDFTRIEREGVYKILENKGIESLDAGFKKYKQINYEIQEEIEQGRDIAELLNQRFKRTLSSYNIEADGV